MQIAGIKQSLRDAATQAVDVFTTGKRDGVRETILLLLTCTVSSLIISSLLLLYLLFTLGHAVTVAGGIAGCFGGFLTGALFLSKQMHCLSTLFMVSIFMKKSRNLLLTAGTSLVVLRNIRNTLENLTALFRSMICNLRAQKAAIAAPFASYVRTLKWLGGVLRRRGNLPLVQLDSQLNVSAKVEVEGLGEKLEEAEKRLNETVTYTRALMETVSAVAERTFPTLSLLLLMFFISLHIKKYCCDAKYKNTFICPAFVRFDEKRKAEGKPHVLPLTPKEEKTYTLLPSVRPTAKEGKAALKFALPIASHLAVWVIFITTDALSYWFVEIFTTKLSEIEPLHVSLMRRLTGFSLLVGIHLDEENLERDFSFSLTLFEKQCLPQPKLLLHTSVPPLAAIVLTLVVMAMLASKMGQLRLLVCGRFFSDATQTRVEHLHAKILRKRHKGRKDGKSSHEFTSLIYQPHFWCPLIFRPKEHRQCDV